MLLVGGMEHPPMVVDPKCWLGFGADLTEAPEDLRMAFESPGRFNKFALVSGRLEYPRKRPMLRIESARQIQIGAPMRSEEEDAFFKRMVREKAVW